MKNLVIQMATQDTEGFVHNQPDVSLTAEMRNGDVEVVRQSAMTTSTPNSNKMKRVRSLSSSSSTITTTSSDLGTFPLTPDFDGDRSVPFSSLGMVAEGEQEYHIPVVGYEIMEERARFTVFKIRVQHQSTGEQWHVFRRYTDFVRLNRKLRAMFPGIRFKLPTKRWFGDNFDSSFLEDRTLGLQAYIDNIILHRNIYQSVAVREFFCFDEPPSVNDSLEESQARCDSLEEVVYKLRDSLQEKNGEVERLKAELALVSAQLSTLMKSLRLECSITSLNDTTKRSASMQKLHSLNVTLLNVIETSKSRQPGRSASMVDLPSRNSCSFVSYDNTTQSSHINEDQETEESGNFLSAQMNGVDLVHSPDSETGEAPSAPEEELPIPSVLVENGQLPPEFSINATNGEIAEK